ncbi:MAG TPA: hypothetical protein VFV33_04135 [Gemmatimonadaceae bacterium]|nr:hypothetical protein [Gemmatimonadaceae bacterium]
MPSLAATVLLAAAVVAALSAPAGAQPLSSSAVAKAAGSAVTQLEAQMALMARQLAELQAFYAEAMRRWNECMPGGSKNGTSECSSATSNSAKAEADRLWGELQAAMAEQREREATLAAMRRIAAELVYTNAIVALLGGKGGSLGAIPGLDAFKSAIDQSLVVDRTALTLRFRTGRLAHCFSPRSVCDAKPYDVGR